LDVINLTLPAIHEELIPQFGGDEQMFGTKKQIPATGMAAFAIPPCRAPPFPDGDRTRMPRSPACANGLGLSQHLVCELLGRLALSLCLAILVVDEVTVQAGVLDPHWPF
jgi:hypothetical protein